MLLRIQCVWSDVFFFFFFYHTFNLKTHFAHSLNWVKTAGMQVLNKKNKTHPDVLSPITTPYLSLTREKAVKCIARDVSRAFYGLREWLVSCDFPMGLWWGWKDVTQRAVSMRAERGGGNLEWFSQGTTLKELGNRVSRFLMCCRYFPLFFMVLDNMLLNDFLFWNVWCADVQTEGWKKLKTGEKRRNIFRFYAISISVGFAVKMQWTRVGWGV